MVWLSIKEVSILLDVSERAVQKGKDKYQYRYVSGMGRGGKKVEIALESLPQKVQDKYNNVHIKKKNIAHWNFSLGNKGKKPTLKLIL